MTPAERFAATMKARMEEANAASLARLKAWADDPRPELAAMEARLQDIAATRGLTDADAVEACATLAPLAARGVEDAVEPIRRALDDLRRQAALLPRPELRIVARKALANFEAKVPAMMEAARKAWLDRALSAFRDEVRAGDAMADSILDGI